MMRYKNFSCANWILSIVSLFIVFTFIFGCASKEKEIKIGVILPLTGDFSSHGEDAKKGIDLAVDEINNQGGIKDKKIIPIYEDDKMQASIGVSAFEKLTNIDRVQVVIGGVGSSVALAIAPIAERKKIVFISPTASNPKLTHAGDYIFRIWPSDIYEGGVMADFIHKLNIKTVAIFYVNNDFGQVLKKIFREKFNEQSFQVLIEESYDQGDTDFRTQLSKIKERNPDGIYLPGYYQEVAKIAVQIKELGIKSKLFSTSPIENPDLIKLAGKAVDNIIYTRPAFDPQNPNEKYKSFSQSFTKKYGDNPGIAATYSYDCMGVIQYTLQNIPAVEKATGEIIQKIMIGIKDYNGVSGKFSFDKNGDVVREMILFTIKNGKFVPY